MFFPDKRAAFAEPRRALRPGGSFLFNAWDALEKHEFESALVEGRAESAASLAAGYWSGTPLGAELEARGDLGATTAIVAAEMKRRLGAGLVIGRMAAHVIHAVRQ